MAINPIEVQKALKGVDYPASVSDLVDNARKSGASNDVVSALEALGNSRFESPAEVNKAIGNDD